MSFPYLSDLIKALTGHDLPLPIPMLGLLVVVLALGGLAGIAVLSRRPRPWPARHPTMPISRP